MSTVARPRGPLPARVYWTRRLVLLSVVVLIGWLMVRWIDGGDSGASASGGDDRPAAATQEDDDQAAKRKRKSERRERTARVRTIAESFERPREKCDLANVHVQPSVAEPVYAGEPAQITLRISTSSSKACSLRVDPDHLLVSISSGRDVIWDSTRCDDAIQPRELALQPRWSSLLDVTWSGRHSGRRCAPDASAAEPGTYTVESAVLEGEPASTDFEVLARPKPPADQDDKGTRGGKNRGGQDGDPKAGDDGDDAGSVDKGGRTGDGSGRR